MRSILVKESGSRGHDVLHLLVAHFLHHLQGVETADGRRADILRVLHFFLFQYLLQILVILVRRTNVEAILGEVLSRRALMLARTLRQLRLTLDRYITLAQYFFIPLELELSLF